MLGRPELANERFMKSIVFILNTGGVSVLGHETILAQPAIRSWNDSVPVIDRMDSEKII